MLKNTVKYFDGWEQDCKFALRKLRVHVCFNGKVFIRSLARERRLMPES